MSFVNRLEFLDGCKILNKVFWFYCFWKENLVFGICGVLLIVILISSYYLVFFWCSGGEQGLVFLLISQIIWGCRFSIVYFIVRKQIFFWVFQTRVDFFIFFSSFILFVIVYVFVQVYSKWFVLLMIFSFVLGKGLLDKFDGTSLERLLVFVIFRFGCVVEYR